MSATNSGSSNSLPGRGGLSAAAWPILLLVLLLAYAAWLAQFTVFEGLATLSNDAPSYMVLANKWSPWFTPTLAESVTWPVHTYPPAFPALLALTGASESTYAAHIAVTAFLVAALAVFGWMVCARLGWRDGLALTLCAMLLPGAVVHSMGILSENLYVLVSLLVLWLYSVLRKQANAPAWMWLALAAGVCVLVLTRSIGMAMIVAMAGIALFDRQLPGRQRGMLIAVAIAGVAVQQVWGVLDPQSQESSYLNSLAPALGNDAMSLGERVAFYFGTVRANAATIVSAWNQYLSLSQASGWYFWFTFGLLLVCMVATAVRALKLRLGACYILVYLLVLLGWPFPDEMVRFLHPIVMLVLLQPWLLLIDRQTSAAPAPAARHVLLAVFVLLVAHSAMVQAGLYALKKEARQNMPGVEHSLEYYTLPNRERAQFQSLVFQDVMALMTSTQDIVPEQAVVASAQQAAYSLLAGRPAVMLSAIVPFEQQLCNFRLRNVAYVFLAPVVNTYNLRGMELLADYEGLTSHVWTINGQGDEPRAHLLRLDAEQVNAALEQAIGNGFVCETARDRPGRG